jgi:hypothetical protein
MFRWPEFVATPPPTVSTPMLELGSGKPWHHRRLRRRFPSAGKTLSAARSPSA